MNTRTFLKLSGLAAFATALAPAMFTLGAKDWPEYDAKGRLLRKIYRVAPPFYKRTVRVRMKDLKSGDLFYTDTDKELYRAKAKPSFDDGNWWIMVETM